jgi:phenylacetate-CoA ligase
MQGSGHDAIIQDQAWRQCAVWPKPVSTVLEGAQKKCQKAINRPNGWFIIRDSRFPSRFSFVRAATMNAFPLEPIEKASRDELQALQLKRMQWSLQHAYDKVPHYKGKFTQAGVHPTDLKTLADLARFPFTTKADLRDTYPYGMFAVPMADVARIHASSGTTGKPTVVGYTKADIDTWANCMARSIRAAGARPGDKVHVSYGYGLFTGGLGAHYGAERLGVTVIPFGGGQTERQVQLINDFKPDIIMVTPSYMLAIADEFERQGLDARQSSLRIGIFGAEPWTPAMRSQIEARVAMDAIDIYGLSEVMGPGVAQECIETKDGLTVWEDHFYPEVIDPETGAVLPDGKEGELVFTSLSKEALPIIRYRTRDLTRLLPGTARTMRRIQKITGRSDDMLIIRGVNVFPTQIEELLLKVPALAPHYQIEITRPDKLDEIAVLVEMKPEHAHADTRAPAKALEQAIKTMVGVSAQVRVEAQGAVERSIGKAKRVVDKRPK